MLVTLHVKNLALIDKVDVEFGEGLNILTGETGAGKSIIIGSVNIALGGKVPKDIIRKGADYAYIELVFEVTDQEKLEALKAMDVIPAEDGLVIVSKKIMPSRSVSKINDETVTAAKLRQITGLLIDIHGQHEHQSLLYKSKHLEILDAYINSQTQTLKQNIADAYRTYQELTKKMEEFTSDQEARLREADFCRFEINEIEQAALKDGEEEELTEKHRRLSNFQKIAESLNAAYEAVTGDVISHAVRQVNDVVSYDPALRSICDQLFDADAILSDVGREISDYMDNMSLDEQEFKQIEDRLDQIRGILAKYGGSVGKVLAYLEEKKEKLETLEHFDEIRQKTEADLAAATHKLDQDCQKLSQMRKKAAKDLTAKIKQGLNDLNFIDVIFTMEFERLDHYTASGYDEAEFLISTNPGEPVKPLGMVASGGELSRIMLAIKTVLADSDEIPTLIFDEIDTGISGRTAQKVSEKLRVIAGNHQVICITHLPQIAAMADCHYQIEKTAAEGRTVTTIRPLNGEEMIEELARLLGGVEITDTVRQNAREMKKLASKERS